MGIDKALETIAVVNGFEFVHARRDYQNLMAATQFVEDGLEGLEVGETVLFLDPVSIKTVKDGKLYSGNFMIITKSDLDDSYESKREKYIEPLKVILDKAYRSLSGCQFDINDWTSIEVINVFDFNGDGMSVRFNVKGYN